MIKNHSRSDKGNLSNGTILEKKNQKFLQTLLVPLQTPIQNRPPIVSITSGKNEHNNEYMT